MTIFKRSMSVVGVLMIGACPLFAAPAGSSEISLRAGGAIPVWANELDSAQGIGPMGGASYLYQLTSNVSVGGKFDYFHLPGKTQAEGPLDANAVIDAYSGQLLGRYSFIPDARWVPYVSLGAGVARVFQKTRATPNDGNTWANTGTSETRLLGDTSSTGYAVSYGGGVQTMFAANWIAAMELTWNTLGTIPDRIGTSALNFPDVSLRLGWRFGGQK